jgi:AraC family transcriptional regulator
MEFAFSHKEFEFNGVIFKRRAVSGFSLVELNYSPNIVVSNHAHEQANFCMAIEGGCTETYGTKMREYKPFTLGFLPPYRTHSIKTSSNGMRAFSIDVAPQWLERMRECSLDVEDSVYCPGGVLIQLLMKLYHEFQNMDAASPLAVEGLALEMLAEVSRNQLLNKETKSPRWLKQAREIINDDFSTHLSLNTIAEKVGVHPVHLARTFRRHYDCTIGEYIRKIRIEFACRKMTTSETPLIEIALNTGFSDQSHFTRIFKRLKGMTPAEYRVRFDAR